MLILPCDISACDLNYEDCGKVRKDYEIGDSAEFNAVKILPVQLIEVETSGEIFGEGPGVGYTL